MVEVQQLNVLKIYNIVTTRAAYQLIDSQLIAIVEIEVAIAIIIEYV